MWSKKNTVKTASFGSTKGTSFHKKPPSQLLPPHKAGCEVLVYCKNPTPTCHSRLKVFPKVKPGEFLLSPAGQRLLNMNSLTSSPKTTSTQCLPRAEGDWRSEQVKYFCIIISLSLKVSLNSPVIPSHKNEHLL